MSLSNDVFNSENIYRFEKLYTKKVFFCIYFSVVHISFNFALSNLNFCEAVDDITIEGTVSEFCFMYYSLFYDKKRVTFCHFSLNIFSKFYRK